MLKPLYNKQGLKYGKLIPYWTTDNSKPIELTVSYDGSWQKRGFTSKYGIGCCIEAVSYTHLDVYKRQDQECHNDLIDGKKTERGSAEHLPANMSLHVF